jgi:hypothetical protein
VVKNPQDGCGEPYFWVTNPLECAHRAAGFPAGAPAWIQQNFAATTVGGITVYDLTTPIAA